MATPSKANNSVAVPTPPQFVNPPVTYDQGQQTQLINVLRLYSAALNSAVAANTQTIASNNVLTWLNL
jgi:hypothetical protein